MIPFRELDPDSLRRIVDLELQALTEREGFVRRNLELLVSDEAKQLLSELGHHPKFGARPLKRVIEERVMTPLAIELARKPKLRDLRVQVRVVTGQLHIEFEPNR